MVMGFLLINPFLCNDGLSLCIHVLRLKLSFSVIDLVVGMSWSSLSSSSQSPLEVNELTSGSSRVEVVSSSSGGMPLTDSKAFAALQVMRS